MRYHLLSNDVSEESYFSGLFEQSCSRITPMSSNSDICSISIDDVVSTVRSVVLPLLESSDVSNDAQLLDYGLDSLGVTELAGQLALAFKVKLPPTLLFTYPTVSDIAKFIKVASI